MLKPIGFWSYSSTDDQYSRGRLSQLRALLAAELQQKIGRTLKVNIFQDVAAIPPGAEWEKQIQDALNASFFLIPIITPALLQSKWCCKEITLFRQREAMTLCRNDLIFPLHYISIDHIDASHPEECHDPEVVSFLRSRQWIDFRAFRLKNPENEEVAHKIEAMADAICSALRRVKQNTSEEKTRSSADQIRDKFESEQPEQQVRRLQEIDEKSRREEERRRAEQERPEGRRADQTRQSEFPLWKAAIMPWLPIRTPEQARLAPSCSDRRADGGASAARRHARDAAPHRAARRDIQWEYRPHCGQVARGEGSAAPQHRHAKAVFLAHASRSSRGACRYPGWSDVRHDGGHGLRCRPDDVRCAASPNRRLSGIARR
jgi:hypothetical protein